MGDTVTPDVAVTPESSTSESEVTTGNEEDITSRSAETTPEDDKVPFHKHPRWQQLMEERRELQAKVSDLETKISTIQPTQRPVTESSFVIKRVQRYISQGSDEQTALQLAREDEFDMRSMAEQATAPIRMQNAQNQIEKNIADFKKDKADFDELDGEMAKTFKSYSPEEQQMLLRNPKIISMLYNQAKSERSATISSIKKTDTSIKGTHSPRALSTTSQKWSRSKIKALSLDEYKVHQAEIDTAEAKGEIADE